MSEDPSVPDGCHDCAHDRARDQIQHARCQRHSAAARVQEHRADAEQCQPGALPGQRRPFGLRTDIQERRRDQVGPSRTKAMSAAVTSTTPTASTRVSEVGGSATPKRRARSLRSHRR